MPSIKAYVTVWHQNGLSQNLCYSTVIASSKTCVTVWHCTVMASSKAYVTVLNCNHDLLSKLYVLHDNIIYVIVLITAYVTAQHDVLMVRSKFVCYIYESPSSQWSLWKPSLQYDIIAFICCIISKWQMSMLVLHFDIKWHLSMLLIQYAIIDTVISHWYYNLMITVSWHHYDITGAVAVQFKWCCMQFLSSMHFIIFYHTENIGLMWQIIVQLT